MHSIPYEHIFEIVPSMVHSIDSEGKIINVSNLWLSKMGYSRSEVIGEKSTNFLTDTSRMRAEIRVLPELFRSGLVQNVEYEFVTKSGNILPVRLDAVLYINPSNQQQESIAVLTDLKEERRLIRELEARHAATIMASKMAALGEMAGGIAHEINNPLTIIHGKAAQMRRSLARKALDVSALDQMALMIEETTMRIAAIIKGLKSFARDSANDPTQKTEVKNLISDVLLLCQSRFSNHRIDLQVMPHPQDLCIQCRPVEISQVFINLLGNAFDAVLGRNGARVWIDITPVDNFVEFCVNDNGPGVPHELLNRVLEPFFTTKPIGQGTGLGLSIAKGIVESHGGSLRIESEPGLTKFCFSIPHAT